MKYSAHDIETWNEFVSLGELAHKYKSQAMALLYRLSKSKIYFKYGFESISHAASVICGISAITTGQVIQAYKNAANYPAIQDRIISHGYSKINLVLQLRSLLSEQEMISLLEKLTKSALQQYVKDVKGETKPTSALSEKGYFSAYPKVSLIKKLNLIKQRLEKEKKKPVTNSELLNYLVSLDNRQQSNINKKSQTKRDFSKNKTLTTLHKKTILSKTNGICSHPNCTNVVEEIHHPSRQSLYPSKHDNVVALCRNHHRLRHASLLPTNALIELIDKKARSYWNKDSLALKPRSRSE